MYVNISLLKELRLIQSNGAINISLLAERKPETFRTSGGKAARQLNFR
jgi:hypothetical protein